MPALTSDGVQRIFVDCLFKDEEEIRDGVEAQGIIHRALFHPGRLESHREEIRAMLMELPDEYRASGGHGWSFLNMCMDRQGHQWTGLQKIMEELVMLGLALGLLGEILPREQWGAFYAGMPYYVFRDK